MGVICSSMACGLASLSHLFQCSLLAMVDIINCIIGALFGFASELLWRLAAASPICRVERTEDEIAQSEFFVTHDGGRVTTGSNSFVRFCRDVFRPSAREQARERKRTLETMTEPELRRALARHLAAQQQLQPDGRHASEVGSSAASSVGPITPPLSTAAAAAPSPPAKERRQRSSGSPKLVVITEPGRTQPGRSSRLVYV